MKCMGWIMKVLEFENVSKDFCHNNEIINVLNDLSFEVHEGEIVAIVGPSGSGKSTILNLVAKLIVPTKGNVYINGNIGYMFQRDCLFEWLKIYKNILLGLEIQKNKNEENIKSVNRMIQEYGLSDFVDAYPNQLSGGMRQRVALIRTLAVNPDIILLDEPFAALDYQTKLKISNDIYNIIKKEHKTTIIVTHDISEAISMADKIIVLSKRPAEVKGIFDISIKAQTPLQKRQTKEFQDYFSTIWDVINNE